METQYIKIVSHLSRIFPCIMKKREKHKEKNRQRLTDWEFWEPRVRRNPEAWKCCQMSLYSLKMRPLTKNRINSQNTGEDNGKKQLWRLFGELMKGLNIKDLYQCQEKKVRRQTSKKIKSYWVWTLAIRTGDTDWSMGRNLRACWMQGIKLWNIILTSILS